MRYYHSILTNEYAPSLLADLKGRAKIHCDSLHDNRATILLDDYNLRRTLKITSLEHMNYHVGIMD
jgi:hypothetical protein